MISDLFKKVKEICRVKHFLKNKAKYFCNNGTYVILGDGFFCKTLECHGKNVKNPLRKCHIYSAEKFGKVYSQGVYSETFWKQIILFDDVVLMYIKNEKKYSVIKERMQYLLPYIPYNKVNSVFFDNYHIIIQDRAKGAQYSDDYHFKAIIEYILSSYLKANIKESEIALCGKKYKVFQSVQHGDIHDDNIFWDKDIPVFIDYDTIDEYPLFYDLIIYVFLMRVTLLKKYKKITDWIKEFELEKRIVSVMRELNLVTYDGNLDLYIACYIERKISALTRENKNRIYWHMVWMDNFDFSDFPLSRYCVENYNKKLKEIT